MDEQRERTKRQLKIRSKSPIIMSYRTKMALTNCTATAQSNSNNQELNVTQKVRIIKNDMQNIFFKSLCLF